jgi:hypothetical protein
MFSKSPYFLCDNFPRSVSMAFMKRGGGGFAPLREMFAFEVKLKHCRH